MIKKISNSIYIFMITVLSCIAVLTLINCIPKSAIQKNTEESTTYLIRNSGFPVLIEDWGITRMDNYADSMLLNVTYHVDSTRPFHSMVTDSYYRIDGNEATADLSAGVFQSEKPQNNYSRYWHGMQVFLRPLLTICSLSVIRYLLAAMVLLLNLWLCLLLWKRGYRMIMALYITSTLLVDVWMCAFSLEYVSVFLLVASLCLIVVYTKGRKMSVPMILGGVLTCFFDFLTAETLTLTIPLILHLLMRYKDGEMISLKNEWKKLMILALQWLLAYAFMFLIKWGLVYLLSGKDAFFAALSSAAYRVGGQVAGDSSSVTLTGFQMVIGLLLRNLGCLFHLPGKVTGSAVILTGVIVIVTWFSVFYLFRKKNYNLQLFALLLMIGAVPYVRYVVLRNHSFMHYFFTYRAQMATVLACLGALYISANLLQYRKKSKQKR